MIDILIIVIGMPCAFLAGFAGGLLALDWAMDKWESRGGR